VKSVQLAKKKFPNLKIKDQSSRTDGGCAVNAALNGDPKGAGAQVTKDACNPLPTR
jgi:hypothetical protein